MKFSFLLAFLATTLSTSAQALKVDSFSVSRNVATVYLSNGDVEAIQAINLSEGKTENRQGIMLAPPIKPGGWEVNGAGKTVPVDFSYTTGFSAYNAYIFVVEGALSADGKTMQYFGRMKKCIWGDTPNPSDWVKKYSENTYEIPDFYEVMNVSKLADGRYTTQ